MKNRHRFYLALPLVLSMQLTGCASSDGQHTKTMMGGLLGATAGAMAGYYGGGHSNSERTRNTLLGAVAGGAIGGTIGHYLDARDRQNVQNTLNQVPPNNTVMWTNRDTGNMIRMTPAEVQPGRQPCRNYTTEVHTRDGRRIQEQKKACRNASGKWVDVTG